MYEALVEGFAWRNILWITDRYTSLTAKNVASECRRFETVAQVKGGKHWCVYED
jgi:hypothetical protein